ncbi:hypothetical protein FEM33_10550 [Dyadobacter flavalbus]|uniref:Uncharacterized protein n=1 Tax=Dyadobacter flavalbus TaxID=2579942 RepID=A0A5M8QZG1_9BACT|nr:hypothetical protein [Dyadobacter flavalbus]KAA6439793.1 hypothetical protein FEM33_10550 [Dyadobacter flavalbus]
MDKNTLKEKYRLMLEWHQYRLEQNQESLNRLTELLPKLDHEPDEDAVYRADYEELLSLKLIYETSLRNFEGKTAKYEQLLSEL